MPQLVTAVLVAAPHRYLKLGRHQIPVCRFKGELKAAVDALFQGQTQEAH